MASSLPGALGASSFRCTAGRSGTSRCRCSVLLVGADNNGQQVVRATIRVVQEVDEGRAGTSGSDGPGAASADEEHLPDLGGGGGGGALPARGSVVPLEREDLERHRARLPLLWRDEHLDHEQPASLPSDSTR